ncbi:MAG: hypothetical protein JSV96_07880 [Candidatus Aminicenantes bacterium]|nr:MAG: hypothetical protein JSV96_07880 [Candidatus Aminicenantes bacterium]
MRRQEKLSIFFIWIIFASLSFGQEPQHFYNVDKEIKVEGKIQKITMEPRYKNTSPFLIIMLEKKDTREIYKVEVSPVWFFDHDFHKGENLMVIGSLYSTKEKTQSIIARAIRSRGETLILRDKQGFPNWRGGPMKKKGRRKGKRF